MAEEVEPMSEDETEDESLSFSQLNTPMSQNPSKKTMPVSFEA